MSHDAPEESVTERIVRQPVTLSQRIDSDFTYHPPKGDQVERYAAIRDAARQFAHLLADLSPASREQSLALTNLEQSVMWANAAIARNE